jgi:hypothetical protein
MLTRFANPGNERTLAISETLSRQCEFGHGPLAALTHRAANGGQCAAIFDEDFPMEGRDREERGTPIIDISTAPDSALLYQPKQAAPYRCARSDIQENNLLEGQRLLLFFRIPDFDKEIEINDGLQKRKLRFFELSYFF